MNIFDLYYCPICLNASMREHQEFKGLVKCGLCGYTAEVEKHKRDLEERSSKCQNSEKDQKKD